MKLFWPLLSLLSVTSCDPYGFGYKMNPAYILDEAHKAIVNLDRLTFLEITGREALCVYANPEGMQHLKTHLSGKLEIKSTPALHSSDFYDIPMYAGFWVYLSERYKISIVDRVKKIEVQTVVDCYYGVEGSKDRKYIRQKPQKYKRKECRLIKITPVFFPALPLSKKCENLRVTL